MNIRLLLPCVAGLVLSASALAQLAEPDPALRGKVSAAIDKGLDYLRAQQKADGAWTSGEYPGLTGLVAQAFLGAPGGRHRGDEAAQKALAFVRKHARSDGGIYAERMGNYNTSVCLATLLLAGDPKDAAIVEAARKFVVGAQVTGSANPAGDGGFGYEAGGGRQGRPDLDNTVFALEALRQYRDSKFAREVPKGDDLNWQAAIDFVSRCQNLPATNPQKWVNDKAEDKGGFIYTPDGGGGRGPSGAEASKPYGTMTYAGVLSFIYADLKKDDPRLVAALDWISRHYTLEENPGQGAQGLYYYYHTMAKGLTVANVGQLSTADGRKVNWRAELAGKLLGLQKADGSWASENARWMEKDPNLVTAYCILALNRLHEGL